MHPRVSPEAIVVQHL